MVLLVWGSVVGFFFVGELFLSPLVKFSLW